MFINTRRKDIFTIAIIFSNYTTREEQKHTHKNLHSCKKKPQNPNQTNLKADVCLVLKEEAMLPLVSSGDDLTLWNGTISTFQTIWLQKEHLHFGNQLTNNWFWTKLYLISWNPHTSLSYLKPSGILIMIDNTWSLLCYEIQRKKDDVK